MSKIAVDIGTTTIKCALFGEDGISAYFGREYSIEQSGVCAQQNPNDWWDIIREGIRAVAPKDSRVEGICISSQGITVVPVDLDGNPLMPALSWLDTRATAQTAAIAKEFGEEYIFSVTGKRLLPDYTMPKIMWLKENGFTAAKYLMPLDYINFKLTGNYLTDYTMASGTMLFDVHRGRYCPRLLKFCGITTDNLAKVLPMGSAVAQLLPSVAEDLGLKPDTMLYLGGQDQKLAALFSGFRKESACVSIGTSTAISLPYAAGGDFSVFRLDKDRLIFEAAIGTTGAAIKWYKNVAGLPSYAHMDSLAKSAGKSAGVEFCIDLVGGGSITGLTAGVTSGNIIYALYEGIAQEIKLRTVPYGIKQLTVCGGGAKSDILCEIIAKVTGCEVIRPPSEEMALCGAAGLITSV